jgi:hypothetical protein
MIGANSLLCYMKHNPNKRAIHLYTCVVRKFRGPSVMSGACGGKQPAQNRNPLFSVHCKNGRLNLVPVDVC